MQAQMEVKRNNIPRLAGYVPAKQDEELPLASLQHKVNALQSLLSLAVAELDRQNSHDNLPTNLGSPIFERKTRRSELSDILLQ